MYLKQKENGVEIQLRAQPNAKQSAIAGVWNETHLKIMLKAPPVDGKANEALIRFMADFCGVPKKNVSFLSGDSAREKRLFIMGVSLETLQQKIDAVIKEK